MPTDTRPLVITANDELLDDILKIANATDSTPHVAPDYAAAAELWQRASIVLCDQKGAQEALDARAPWRPALVLVARGQGSDPPPSEELWRLAADLSADHIAVLPEATRWLTRRLQQTVATPSRNLRTIGVIGGRGGAGSSVLAAALGVVASQQGHRSLLIDADPLGPGIDVTLGQEADTGTRWSHLTRDATAAGLRRLPRIGDLELLTWDRQEITAVDQGLVTEVLDAANGTYDVAVVDLPRYPDEATAAALRRCSTVYLVVPAEVRAVFSASRTAALLGAQCRNLQAVVRGPAPAGLRGADIADVLQLPLAATINTERGLSRLLEGGAAPAKLAASRLADVCRRLLTTLQMEQP